MKDLKSYSLSDTTSFNELKKRYFLVNDVINSIFFDGRFADSSLYLDMEDSILHEISTGLFCEESEVINRIASCLQPLLSSNPLTPFQFFKNTLRQWDIEKPPPFTALLCILSFAAEKMRSDENHFSLNYYDRLYELLGITDPDLKESIKKNFSDTVDFWEGLNSWLDLYDGSFGHPTAQQINNFKYVSYAMSQALVRDAERKNLQKMYEYFDFSPGERIPSDEIYPYVEEWVSSSYSSKSIKNLWTLSGTDKIIAETASDELLNWDGVLKESGSIKLKSKSILVGAQFTGWPKKRLNVFIAAHAPDANDSTILFLDAANSSAEGKLAFRKCSEVYLNPCSIPDAYSLGPTQNINLGAFLSGEVTLEEKDRPRAKYYFKSNPIIPLALDETGSFYCIVSRVSLLKKHILLCHRSCLPMVKNFLKKYARPGFKTLDSAATNLPEQWVTFANVQILHSPEGEGANLQVLSPLSNTSLSITGGLKIGRNIWHSHTPVEIIGASIEEDFFLKFFEGSPSISNEAKLVKIASSERGSALLKVLPSEIQPNQKYFCSIESKGKNLKEQVISLRDADKPLKRAPDKNFLLQLRPEPNFPQGALTATKTTEQEFRNGFQPFSYTLNSNYFAEIRDSHCTNCEDLNEEEFFAYEYDKSTDIEPRENCTTRGFHIWSCQPFEKGDNPKAKKWMACKDCGQTIYIKSGEKNKKSDKKYGFSARNLPPIEKEEFESDTVFDAVCFLGSGQWTKLKEIADIVDNEGWASHEYLRNLNSLGHVNYSFSLPDFKPELWSTSPPFLSVVGEEAFLTGFRSRGFLTNIQTFFENNGFQFKIHHQDNAPDRISVAGDLSTIDPLTIGELKDPLGRPLALAQNLSEQFASLCPVFSKIEDSLKTVHIERRQGFKLEVFNVETGKWLETSHDLAPGAYRTTTWGTTYYFADDNGQKRKASYEIVKLMASRNAKMKLYSYDAPSMSFIAPLGCPVPGLYERSLIYCSGYLPIKDGKRLVYRNVSEKVGLHLMGLLYN